MNRRYSVTVTQDDINEGVRDSSAHCIVSTAIGRAIPDATRIITDVQSIRFTIGNERLIYMTPREVGRYVLAFDDGNFAAIKPMKLELANPVVTEAGRRNTATRLIVKGTSKPREKNTVPTRTRAWGIRTFEVNRASTN